MQRSTYNELLIYRAWATCAVTCMRAFAFVRRNLNEVCAFLNTGFLVQLSPTIVSHLSSMVPHVYGMERKLKKR